MKLKAQIEDEIKYSQKRRKIESLSDAERFYYIGIRDALEWVLSSRNELIHTDSKPVSLSEIND
jgi:hypothetical protein